MNKQIIPHSLTDVLELKLDTKKTIWGPITNKSITLLFGETGVGKSNFTLGLAIAVAAKENFCGHMSECSPRILFLDGEMDKETWAKRIRWIRPETDLHIACDSINFLTRDDFGTGLVPNISLPDPQKMYTEIFKNFNLIIIDNLNTCSYPKRDNDGEIQQFLRVLPWLLTLRDSGKAVILVHHTNKEGKQMGSILKEQIADNVIRLDKIQHNRDSLQFKIIYQKLRHLSKKQCPDVEIEAICSKDGMSWLTTNPLDNLEEKVSSMKKKGSSVLDVISELKADPVVVMDLFNKGRNGYDL